MHELDKLDIHLNLPIGTSRNALVGHCGSEKLKTALLEHGINLDDYGIVPKHQHGAWKTLMQAAGVGQKYWKDKDLLVIEAVRNIGLTDLEGT